MSNPYLLKTKTSRILFQIILFVTLLVAIFASTTTHTFTQSSDQRSVKWLMTLEPESGEIKAQLHIQLLEPNPSDNFRIDGDEYILVDEIQREILCSNRHGQVIVRGNEILFDGNSSLLCRQPNIYSIVQNAWGITLENNRYVNINNFFVDADAVFTPSSGEQPLIYTSSGDTRFSLIAESDSVSSRLAYLKGEAPTVFEQGVTEMQSERLHGCNHGRVLVEHVCENGNCLFKHHVTNSQAEIDPTPLQEVLVRVAPQSIYIGHNPDTNTYFKGRLKKLVWDPHASGGGVGFITPPPTECGDAYWTDWLNRDTPNNRGDYETTSAFPTPVCRANEIILDMEARSHTIAPFAYGDSTPQVFSNFNPIHGLECRNSDQLTMIGCHDYEVRYQCQPLDEPEYIPEAES